MPLTTPDSAADVDARAKADVQTSLSLFNGNPFLRNSWLGALVTAFANRIFDFYYALDQALAEAFPDTAVDKLEQWASVWGISRIAGTKSTGNVVATGVASSSIPTAAVLVAGDGQEYEATAAAVVTALTSVAVTSITRVATLATCTTTASHGLASNVKVTITGANESDYNVTNAAITVTGATTFTYIMAADPGGSATGTPVGAWTLATVAVRALEFGADGDQLADAVLEFQSPLVGIDDTTRTTQDAIGGGADQETDAALRARLLDRIQNPVAHFNVAEITAKAKTVSGVTRVFVEEITPAVGQVTVYFMRDNESPAIPSGAEVALVKAALDTIRPAASDTDDLIVAAPTAVSTDFTFSALSPDTATMRTAVEASLNEFFDERTTVGANVDEDAYRSAIFNTVDTATGSRVTSFALSAPGAGDITIVSGEIGTLGNVNFP